MFDSSISGGMLVDPEAKQTRIGSIGIKYGKIAALSAEPLPARVQIDAAGLVVCPGFIDVHSHVDGHSHCAELSALQGITTTVGGNCGLSPLEMDAFLTEQTRNGFIINQAELVGHSFSLRRAVGAEDVYAPATAEQIDKMVYMADKALEEGACGPSFGLDYAPGGSFEEISALSRVAVKYGRIVPIHTRLFTDIDLYSLTEAIAIARVTGASVLVSHFIYQYGAGIMEEALLLMDRAISEGLNVRIDSGMYTPWATNIETATFDESHMLTNPGNLKNFLVATGPHKGRRLDLELYKELRVNGENETIISLNGTEEEIFLALMKSYAMPSTDTGDYRPGEGHPQVAGTFPRYIRQIVRERQDLPLIEAIRKATLLPAQTIGLKGKGRLAIGADADIVAFDLNRITDRADYPDRGLPDAPPEGIAAVLVNGVPVVLQGALQSAKPGRAIRF